MRLLPSFLAVMGFCSTALSAFASIQVIAHRGACGYLPEHTLESASYAYAVGSDYIEQDVVLSKDAVLVVCHDIHIDTVTNVAERFPGRSRKDGRYYALDFTWEELRSLRVRERTDPTGKTQVFPRRFPSALHSGDGFRLCTMEEQILLIQGLNHSTGRKTGLCPEIKAPRWHREQGRDPGTALLGMLAKYGYTTEADGALVQCFDPEELRRLRAETATKLPFVQLLSPKDPEEPHIDFDSLCTPDGLTAVAGYAQYVGPHFSQLVAGRDAQGLPRFTSLVAEAHARGLKVIPYTFRTDALPPGIKDFDTLLALFTKAAGVDGVFADQPDAVLRYLGRR